MWRGSSIDFESPHYLWLLAIAPVLWVVARNSLAGIGWLRAAIALVLRTAVLVALVLALAEAQWVERSDRVAVMYLVDGSLSVSRGQLDRAIEYVNASALAHRDQRRGDMAGVIVFGREAAIEVPPYQGDLLWKRIETPLDPRHTDLSAAMRLAHASLPTECARRVVVITDGNETLGSASDEARRLAADGVGIDVVPIRTAQTGEVAVEKVVAPPDVRGQTPFDVRVVLNHHALDPSAAPVAGRLEIARVSGQDREMVVSEDIALPVGKRVFSFRDEIADPQWFSYEVNFVPSDPRRDAFAQNNRAEALVRVRGQGRVLLVENAASAGEFDGFAESLSAAGIAVSRATSREPFADLAELQQYDAVILADVPRAGDDAPEGAAGISDAQVDVLIRNTRQLGCGLVMLGGPNSFGAGGWDGSPIEEAMPVDFQVDNLKVVPVGALALVIDKSGSMDGEKLAMSRSGAIEALKALGQRDFLGVYAFDSAAHTIVPMSRMSELRGATTRIGSLGSGGGTDMKPGMLAGYQDLLPVEAAVKHMVVLSDGQTHGAGYVELATEMRSAGITTTCVAVGADADSELMRNVAAAGGGKFYHVHNPGALPRVFMREARRVARPVVFEDAQGIAAQTSFPHEILSSVGPPPAFTGYVLTTVKNNPLVETALVASKPSISTNALLASWTYGLGRSVAWTTDVGQRWTSTWSAWSGRDKLFEQMIRWAMRPTGDDSRLSVFSEVDGGVARVVVTALDRQSEFINFLPLSATVIEPDLELRLIDLEQTAPGRYVAEFPADEIGGYFLSITDGAERAPQRAALMVPYSREFTAGDANVALVERLARERPTGGEVGATVGDGRAWNVDEMLETNVYRGGLARAEHRDSVWPSLIFVAACLFVGDVFNRRVAIGFGWLYAAAGWAARWAGRRSVQPAETSEHLARLHSRKAEVDRQLDARHASKRFDAADEGRDLPKGDELAAVVDAARTQTATLEPTATDAPAADAPAVSDYTDRLLRAKRRVWEERR